jgi:oxygen-dependent protoporphyrinogen oxidase
MAPAPRSAVVLGGGLSGLATAWFLRRLRGEALRVTVVEGAQRAGGWVNTVYPGGHVLESGPRGVRPQGAGQETLSLAEQLGLQGELIAADPAAKMRFIYLDGRIQRMPGGLLEMFRAPTTSWLPPVLRAEMNKARGTGEDESIADFITRRFNGRVLDQLVDPLTSGVFAGDPSQLSVRSCFGRLYQLEQDHGSVVRGLLAEQLPWPFGRAALPADRLDRRSPPESELGRHFAKAALVSFRGGMSTLTESLTKHLDAEKGQDGEDAASRVLYGAAVSGLDFSSPEHVTVRCADGRTLQADHVFSALPAPAASALMAPHSKALAAELGDISYAPVALVTMAWDQCVLPPGLIGFGHLVPFVEQQEVIGVTWDSCTFPQQGLATTPTRLTVFVGGSRHAPRLRELVSEGRGA